MDTASPPAPGGPDDELVADLRRVLAAVDPIPEHVQLAARLAIEWRTLDAELAALALVPAGDARLVATSRSET